MQRSVCRNYSLLIQNISVATKVSQNYNLQLDLQKITTWKDLKNYNM